MDSPPQRFRIRYGFWRPVLSLLGLGPAFAGLELDDQTLCVRMGWGFRSAVPLSSVQSARRSANRWGGIGVHGQAGRWLVNGSVAGIVRIVIDPPAEARVIGFRAQLRLLEVSLEDPDQFIAEVDAVAR